MISLYHLALRPNQIYIGMLTIFLNLMVVFSEIDLAIDICIECDASLSGWGAFYNGQSANGHWPTLEALKDINYLELLAALWFCKPLCLTDKLFLSVTKAR